MVIVLKFFELCYKLKKNILLNISAFSLFMPALAFIKIITKSKINNQLKKLVISKLYKNISSCIKNIFISGVVRKNYNRISHLDLEYEINC